MHWEVREFCEGSAAELGTFVRGSSVFELQFGIFHESVRFLVNWAVYKIK